MRDRKAEGDCIRPVSGIFWLANRTPYTPISFCISEGLAEIEVIIYTESFSCCSLNILSRTDLHLQFYLPKWTRSCTNMTDSQMFVLAVSSKRK